MLELQICAIKPDTKNIYCGRFQTRGKVKRKRKELCGVIIQSDYLSVFILSSQTSRLFMYNGLESTLSSL